MRQTLSRLEKESDLLLTAKLWWSETFNLPPNDQRLLSLTVREALEQCWGRQAIHRYLWDKAKRRAEHEPIFDGDADHPIETGDPEWDAEERELTSEDAGFSPEEIQALLTGGPVGS